MLDKIAELQKKIRLLEAHIDALDDVWDRYDPNGNVEAAAAAIAALKEKKNDIEN